MTVIKGENGKWIVVGAHEQAGPFDTMSEAWRWIDRHTGSPINRSEDKAEWLWQQRLDS